MSPRRIAVLIFTVLCIGIYVLSQSFARTESKAPSSVSKENVRTAIFAGGCFWCMEPPFERLSGVMTVESGYTGGFKKSPQYKEVSGGETGHVEAVRVSFDVTQIKYEDLLEVFWRNVDPTDDGGQFVDRGPPYRSAIFVATAEQRLAAEKSKQALENSGQFEKPIVTPIRDAGEFYLAEDYHQDYYKTHALKYKFYRYRSGRDQFIDAAWGDDRNYVPPRNIQFVSNANGTKSRVFVKPTDDEIRKRLTPLQYRVTQNEATERSFANEFWDNSEEGIYVDVVSGEPLFSSKDKFKSGTGWPSFSQPMIEENVVKKTDYKLFFPRTEVRSKHGDSHLGHVFKDGPAPTSLRFCINSAALRFVPTDRLEAEGYGQFKSEFERKS